LWRLGTLSPLRGGEGSLAAS